MANYDKLNLGRTLSSWDGDNNNHGDCFNYGSVGGCDENCPALNDGKCEIYKNVDDYEGDEIEVDETSFAFESNFPPSNMTEQEWNKIHE